jgi:hypothetical protein
VHELLLDDRCLGRGVVPPGELTRDLRAFYDRPRFYPSLQAGRLWRWITLELWFRDFIDGEGFRPHPPG